MALDEHLPNGDKTLLALQLVSGYEKEREGGREEIQFETSNQQTNKGQQ